MYKKFTDELCRTFWPIESRELKKFVSLAIMMFCILFNYTIVRALKDSLIIPSIGAEAIGFIKLWAVFPAAILFVIIYDYLIRSFNEEKVFYIFLMFFLLFFTIFGFFLLENINKLHPDTKRINNLVITIPNLKWIFLIYGKWTYAMFYVIAELWGSIMLSLLFWQFANKLTTTQEAKRFYPMLGLFANLALIVAGICIKHISDSANLMLNEDCLTGTNNIVTSSVKLILFAGFIIILTFTYLNKILLKNTKSELSLPTKLKKKISFKESLRLVLSSRYLGYIALLVLCYGISINLVEGPWKAKIREYCPTNNEYLEFMGMFIKWTGIGSLISFFIGSNILRRTSWRISALITPILMMISGISFFIFSIYSSHLDGFLTYFLGISSLTAAVFFGMAQNILSKATKYSFFDSTKEMAYIPIDKNLKTTGKAAVDVIGGRLGKSGGALIQVLIFTIFHTANFDIISPWLMIIFIFVLCIWIWTVNRLNKEYIRFGIN